MLRFLSRVFLVIVLLTTSVSDAATLHTGGANLIWNHGTSLVDTAKSNHSMSVTFIPHDVTHTSSTTWGQVIAFVGQSGLMSLSMSTTGYPRFRWYRATGTWETVTGAAPLENNTPYTLVGTWSKGASCYVYTNGVPSSPVTSSNANLANGGGVYFNSIGGVGHTNGPYYGNDDINFRGIVSEACVWNDIALTQQDAINISSKVVASCRDVHPEKLTAYWTLDEYPDGTDVDGYYYYSQDPIHVGSTTARLLVEGNTYITAVAEPQLTHK